MNKNNLIPQAKKNVLITGVTSGIGRAISKEFAEHGWNIIGHYFSSKKRALDLKQRISEYGVDCALLKADFSSKNDLRLFINKIRKYKIDSLVNNAGTYIVNKHFSQLTIDEITAVFMVNVFAPMFLTANLFMQMKKRRFGRIVNISSIAAKYGGSSFSMAYGASKRSLEGITKTLAKEGAESNVLVNTVRPGVIDTDFHKKFPKDMRKRISIIPLKRMGRPEEVAEMVYYLGSEKNNFITNEIFSVAGGE